MTEKTIVIGFTQSDPQTGYSSFADGYRPGAAEHLIEIEVDGPQQLTGEDWAEAVWVASNAPLPQIIVDQPGATAVHQALVNLAGSGVALRSLSKGDTVSVDGVLYACAGAGWEAVDCKRCDARARRGTGESFCGRPRDEHGCCDRASDHIEADR